MICKTCSSETSHVKILPNGTEMCHSCGGFSESGGTKTDRLLTLNSDRIREQQSKYEGDMIPPYIVDKNTKQVVVNDDFIQAYPNQAADTYSTDELKKSGHGNLKKAVNAKKQEEAGVQFSGDASERIKEIAND